MTRESAARNAAPVRVVVHHGVVASVIHEPDRPRKPWRVDYTPRGGRRTTLRFKSKREAVAFARDAELGVSVGLDHRVTVKGWMRQWFRTHGAQWERVTQTEVAYYGDRWIYPWIGGVRLTDLSTVDVREWRTSIMSIPGRGKATAYTANKACSILSRALNAAVADGVLVGNPAAPLRKVKHEKREVIPATLQQIERLRAVLDSPRDRVVVSLMAYAGLRPGEVCALLWRDVTGEGVTVRRSMGSSGMKRTKTGSTRTIAMIDPLRSDLDAARGLGERVTGIDDWDNWTPLFRAGLRRAGMPAAFHPYAMRHTFASLHIAAKKMPHEVAPLLGHSSPQLTLSTYGHLFDEAQLRDGEPIEEAVVRARHDASVWRMEISGSSPAPRSGGRTGISSRSNRVNESGP